MNSMMNHLASRACVAVLAAVPAVASTPSDSADGLREALAARADAALEHQRGGSTCMRILDQGERAELRILDARQPTLADQRAGDLSNEDLKTILLVLGILAALVIIF